MQNDLFVCHLIPQDGLGGVETAARSMAERQDLGIKFKLVHLSGKSYLGQISQVQTFPKNTLNSPISYFHVLLYLINAKPDVLICSLWRSLLIGIIFKIFSRKTKVICFLHSSSTAHFIDTVISGLAIRMMDFVWADSTATIVSRLSLNQQAKSRVISFILYRPCAVAKKTHPLPNFIFWGRLSKPKGINRALQFFAKFNQINPDASFHIWGPDGGYLSQIKSQISLLNLKNNVFIHGPTTRDQLQNISHDKSFFLQLSYYEGMSISVTEAMGLGLIPIVTAVGEIGNYCQHNLNSIIVDITQMDQSVSETLNVLNDVQKYLEMSQAATSHWQTAPLYSSDVVKSVRAVLQ